MISCVNLDTLISVEEAVTMQVMQNQREDLDQTFLGFRKKQDELFVQKMFAMIRWDQTVRVSHEYC